MSPAKKLPKKPAANKTASAKQHGAATVKASVFKAKCLDIMDEVQQRHTWVIVTKHGSPVARLGPVDDTPPNPFGFLRGTVVSDHALVDAEHDSWTESSSDPLG